MKFLSPLLLGVVLLSQSQVWAGEALTLNDCFKAALKRSEVLASQQELVVQAEEHYSQAWGSILPSFNGYYSYFKQDTTGQDSTSSSPTQTTLKITGDQPLFRGFREYAAIDQTKKLITAQKEARNWAGMQLYMDTTRGFYTLLAAQKDLRIVDEEIGLYQTRIQDLQDRVDIGRSRITEVLTVKSAKAILKAQREQVLGQIKTAKEVFAFLTGLDKNITLDDTEDVPSQTDTLDRYLARLESRPDVIAARRNVEAAKSNISVASGAHLPSADLQGDYYFQGSGLTPNPSWDAQIVVTLPIFQGGIISSNVKIAESQERQYEQGLSSVLRIAAEDIGTYYGDLESDLAQVAALQDAYNAAEKNYKANLADYNLGLVINLDVLQALTSYKDTERSLEKARFTAKIDFNLLEAGAAKRLDLIDEGTKP